jgi:hypothetical protein
LFFPLDIYGKKRKIEAILYEVKPTASSFTLFRLYPANDSLSHLGKSLKRFVNKTPQPVL